MLCAVPDASVSEPDTALGLPQVGGIPFMMAGDGFSTAKWAEMGVDSHAFFGLTVDDFDVLTPLDPTSGPDHDGLIKLTFDCKRNGKTPTNAGKTCCSSGSGVKTPPVKNDDDDDDDHAKAAGAREATEQQRRTFPDTNGGRIALLVDQLPSSMTPAQLRFAASHYVGSQKLFVSETRALRAINPSFLMLHYHLGIWQTSAQHPLIINGASWGNDYPFVTTHDSWFWRNQTGGRVVSTVDGKWLMNISNPQFAEYWRDSMVKQVAAGQYDAIFFDSAAPSLIQGETVAEPRLKGTGARTNVIPELGGKTFIAVWEAWIAALSAQLLRQQIPLIPNDGNFATTWDTTNYTLTAGAFSEGFASAGLDDQDWTRSTNHLLDLAARGKLLVLQDYLRGKPEDVALRMFYLGNYLLLKRDPGLPETLYLCYFAQSPLEWYAATSSTVLSAMTTRLRPVFADRSGLCVCLSSCCVGQVP